MRSIRKIAIFALVVLVLGSLSVGALAATNKTPADIVAGLTGKNSAAVIQERSESGKTYGALAKDAGKLSEFKSQMLESKEAALQDMVKAGKLTQERANAIISAMKTNQAACDGNGSAAIGRNAGAGFGGGMGQGQGRGQVGMGRAQGGAGLGRGVCGGSCQS